MYVFRALGENPLIWALLHDIDMRTGGDGFTEEHVKGTFSDLILGGTASTTNLVYTLFNILLHYPHVYAKLKAELDKVTSVSSGHPTLADRPIMPYTQALILELLRYVTIAPFTVPHKVRHGRIDMLN